MPIGPQHRCQVHPVFQIEQSFRNYQIIASWQINPAYASYPAMEILILSILICHFAIVLVVSLTFRICLDKTLNIH
jgi:hypothetical protein